MRLRAPSRYLLLGLFLILLLLVLNAGAFLTYHQVRGTIEEELGERLLGVACATAAGIPPPVMRELTADPAGETARRLRSLLARISFDTGVGDLYVFDLDRRHLLDAEGRLEPGYESPALELHYAAATAALAGVPAASDLYKVGGVYLKTAFSPVLDQSGEVMGVVAAEGGATFFQGLWNLRRQVLVTGAAGMVIVLALALLFYRLLRAQAVAERTLRETSALAAAGELAAILAHEIRNPLAVISSRAERVRAKVEKGRPVEDVLSWFDAIPREVARLDQILAQYLSFARPSEVQGDAAVGATVDAVLSLLSNDFTRKGIEVRHGDSVDPTLRVVMAPAALHQILVNLLLNARDAMPEGGVITIVAKRSGREALLRVEDTGCGMTAEQQLNAFESFYTTKPKGSGLGLAVVRSMVDLYAGRVQLESQPGRGTRFSLWIPAAFSTGDGFVAGGKGGSSS